MNLFTTIPSFLGNTYFEFLTQKLFDTINISRNQTQIALTQSIWYDMICNSNWGYLPNHWRLGWIRVSGNSLDWRSCLRILPPLLRLGLVLYILRRRTVAALRLDPFFPPSLRLASSECFGFPDTFTFFSVFFAILGINS